MTDSEGDTPDHSQIKISGDIFGILEKNFFKLPSRASQVSLFKRCNGVILYNFDETHHLSSVTF